MHTCNPSKCACECDKDWAIDEERLVKITCMKSPADNSVIKCNKVIDTPDTASINSIDKKQYIKGIIIFFTLFY